MEAGQWGRNQPHLLPWDTQGGRLQSAVSAVNQTPAITWQHLGYSYDANGNLSVVQDNVASETLNYSYDSLDRLTSVSGAYSQSYGYDAASGNLASLAGQTLSYTDTAHPHAATGLGSQAYSYDANGNMISRQMASGTYTLSYDAEGRLVGIASAGMNASYTYNGDGARVKAVVVTGSLIKTSAYVGDYFEISQGDSPRPSEPRQQSTPTPPDCSTNACIYLPLTATSRPELPAGHAWMSYYSAGGQRVVMRVQSNQAGLEDSMFYFLSDHLVFRQFILCVAQEKDGTLSSTALTLDEGAGKVAELRYSAWGETRYTDGSTPTQRRYTGQLEAEAGLYYCQARWYDPGLGRFAQPDSIVPVATQGVQAFDRYAYVNNNPIKYSYPSGHLPLLPLLGVFLFLATLPGDTGP